MTTQSKQEELKKPSLSDLIHSIVSRIMTELREDIANHVSGDRSRDSYITHMRGREQVLHLINSEVLAVLEELEKHGAIYNLDTRDKIVFASREEGIEMGIKSIIAIINKDILLIHDAAHKEKIDKAVRSIIDAYAEQKAQELLADGTPLNATVRLQELRLVSDEVGLFTKRRHPQAYNVHLRMDYLMDRMSELMTITKEAR